MADGGSMRESLTLSRRRQRRPDLQCECALPPEVVQRTLCVMSLLEAQIPAVTPPAALPFYQSIRTIHGALDDFLACSSTPELQLRAVSKITAAVRESSMGKPVNRAGATAEDVACMAQCSHIFYNKWIFFMLLDCRVRYLHRALSTLLRTTFDVSDVEAQKEFQESFRSSLITVYNNNAGVPTLFSVEESDATEREHQVRVLHFLNCVDGLTSTVMPMMPAIFTNTFVEMLPLLGDALTWTVSNAMQHRTSGGMTVDGPNTAAPETIYGDDLDHIRFGVRVVATYMHKYMDQLVELWATAEADPSASIANHLTRLMHPAFVMLLSPIFPKDVLNATGLLFASCVTVRSCDAWLINSLCHYLCGAPAANMAGGMETQSSLTATLQNPTIRARVHQLVTVLCAADPRGASAGAPTDAMRSLLQQVTPNGRFALLKGILAHFSQPIRRQVSSIGLLLTPFAMESGTPVVALHEVILPAAEAYLSSIQEPETRFMATQTVDSVVRHISTVMEVLLVALDPEGRTQRVEVAGKEAKRAKASRLPTTTLQEVPPYCLPSKQLLHTLNVATQLAMAFWDDATQHMSSALYGTYAEVLRINECLRRFKHIQQTRHPSSAEAIDDLPVMNVSDTLAGILDVQSERRGKYHALLGLMRMMPPEELVAVLHGYFCTHKKMSSDSASSVCCFSRMLLSVSSNHKVANVAGDVFAELSLRLTSAESTKTLLVPGVVSPLVRSIAMKSYVAVASNVSDSVNIANIAAHVLTPLIKQDRFFLGATIDGLLQLGQEGQTSADGTVWDARVSQGVVEALGRARSVGLDISTYLQPEHVVMRVVREAMQSLHFDQRNMAFALCVLCPRKAELVAPWQCRAVEEYASLNMHLGGDSTARKGLLESLKKWVQRLSDTCNTATPSSPVATAAKTEKEDSAVYREVVSEHCARLVAMCSDHIGHSVAIARGLSIERRVTAMSCAVLLLNALERCSFFGSHPGAFVRGTVVEPLLATLSDGWGAARAVAKDLLLLLARCAPEVVFGGSADAASSSASQNMDELHRACTYRNAEGAVERYMFFTTATPAVVAAERSDPCVEASRRYDACRGVEEEVLRRCATMEVLRGREAFDAIQRNPLHGSISLCSALLTSASNIPNGGAARRVEAANSLLSTATRVMQVCRSLVGTDAAVAEGEVVDCRGHVYDRTNADHEGIMRSVVNNTWLSMRVATLAIQQVVQLTTMDELNYDTVHDMCRNLMHTLLSTKHNGVMRCVRGALKRTCEALVRCRAQIFFHLPALLLSELLGAEGVASDDVSRMLRRSQGLPHAILAVLEAEDPSVPFALFPVAIRHLLRLAQPLDATTTTTAERSEVQCSQRSNALNVLKFIFEDRVLADRSMAHIEDAFCTSTEGFNDESWYIRNSSLMLYSSVLQRFVGEHPSMGGAGVNTSLHDIAKRTPRGVAFAYQELMRGAGASHAHGDGLSSLAVFPVLQMLSMLSPDPPHMVTKATVTEENDAEKMIEAVLRNASSSSLMIRAACATSLTSLVPITQLASRIGEAGQRLMQAMQAPSKSSLDVAHGCVLQWQQYIRTYVGTLTWHRRHRLSSYASPTLAESVLSSTVAALIASGPAWAAASISCPTICAAIFTLLADVLFYTRTSTACASVVPSLVELGSTILASVFVASSRGTHFAITDRGCVRDGAGLFVMLCCSILTSNVISNSSQQMLQSVLRGECAHLEVKAGQHNLLSWVMHHALRLKTADLLPKAPELVAEALYSSYHCDVVGAAMNSLVATLATRGDAATLPIGCVAWMELTTALNFVVQSGDHRQEHQELEGQLEQLLLSVLHTSSTASSMRLNSDATQAAILFVAARWRPHSTLAPHMLEEILAVHAHAEMPVPIRHAVVQAIEELLTACPLRELVVPLQPLLFVLMKLLLDDTAEIRDRACVAWSAILLGKCAVPRDQTTCLLSIMCVVKSLHRGNSSGVKEEVFLRVLMDDSDDEVDAADGESEADEDDGADVLFQKESANMFIEDTMLGFMNTCLYGTPGEVELAFPTLAALMQEAERTGKMRPVL